MKKSPPWETDVQRDAYKIKPFMESELQLSCSQYAVIEPYPVQLESRRQTHILFI
jgi:hypothetical protein